MTVNDKDTLNFEDYSRWFKDVSTLKDEDIQKDCMFPAIERMSEGVREKYFGHYFMKKDGWIPTYVEGLRKEYQSIYPRQSFMLGFSFTSSHLFGLPERSSTIQLKPTAKTDPYRLFAIDLFPHDEWNPQGLYSGIPYLTGHSADHDEALLWINAGESWVDILPPNEDSETEVNIISESGVMEFFLVGSA